MSFTYSQVMLLDQLRVLHLKKTDPATLLAFFPSAGLKIDTCQRTLWIDFESLDRDLQKMEGLEFFFGEEAYHFLLRVATGMESAILGETDVFGQIKTAWREFEQTQISLVVQLRPLIQKVFEDTKEIRKSFLQNLGGTSYGTLVRKWIKQSPSAEPEKQVLLIGAGQIAHSVAPFLSDCRLLLSNRNQMRLHALHEKVGSGEIIQSLSDQKLAWQSATHVVLCIPFDSKQDEKRVGWFLKGKKELRHVLHLGGNAHERSELWNQVPKFTSLNDFFELQKMCAHLRTSQVKQAEKACFEKARERKLQGRRPVAPLNSPLSSTTNEFFSFAY